ncbi:hypothetical protein LSUE1_G005126 [Lachnellula suecica]|uniref:Uncharacterized protein n=1 Tax=Lachnellula suecica TaxID=602035 RepID=A0A8T9C3H2_9HELO|nr:hypothetical protein LSUE1_G005126 [Lachnellula suecica]
MATPEQLVRLYDLSSPKPWSPACWCTRFALNYKGIPHTTVPLSYPAIAPKCSELFPSMTGLEETVLIIEILALLYKALNDSALIARLLNERYTEADSYKDLKHVDEADEYDGKELKYLGRPINALDKEDDSREFFKRTREEFLMCELGDIMEVRGHGEAAVLEDLKVRWIILRERMAKEDGSGEPNYMDFVDASHVKWIEGASEEKLAKLMTLYGDDTSIKLMKKVGPYSY